MTPTAGEESCMSSSDRDWAQFIINFDIWEFARRKSKDCTGTTSKDIEWVGSCCLPTSSGPHYNRRLDQTIEPVSGLEDSHWSIFSGQQIPKDPTRTVWFGKMDCED